MCSVGILSNYFGTYLFDGTCVYVTLPLDHVYFTVDQVVSDSPSSAKFYTE